MEATLRGGYAVASHDLSERRACSVPGVSRSVLRYRKRRRANEEVRLRKEILELVRRHRLFGYRRITKMLQPAGWRVNYKRVWRIWLEEGYGFPNECVSVCGCTTASAPVYAPSIRTCPEL